MRIINNTDANVGYSRLTPTVGSGTLTPGEVRDLDLPHGTYSFALLPPNHFALQEVKNSATVEIAVTVK